MPFNIVTFWQKTLGHWFKDQSLLLECFLVALSLHVALFPILWIIGWALPWPKSPVITTIIEYDLDENSLNFKPKHIIDFRDPKFN